MERIVAFVWALAGLGSYSVSTPRSSSMVSTGPSAGSSSSGGRESQVWPSVPQRRSARSSSLSASLMEVRERRASAGTAAPSEMINVYYMYRMEAREHELLRAQAATHHVQGVRRVKHVPAMLSKGGHCTRERRALVQCGQMSRAFMHQHAHTHWEFFEQTHSDTCTSHTVQGLHCKIYRGLCVNLDAVVSLHRFHLLTDPSHHTASTTRRRPYP